MTDVLYAAKGSTVTNSDLYTVDTGSPGSPVSVGSTGFGMTGLAQDPTSGILYGATSASSSAHPNSLISLDTTTGAGTFIGAFGVTLADIGFDSTGVLYGLRNNNGNLYTVNLGTGAATLVGAASLPGTVFGCGFSLDASDKLWACPTGDDQELYSYNKATGATTDEGTLSGAPDAGVSVGGIAAMSYTPDGTTLYGIDTIAGTSVHLVTLNTSTFAFTDLGSMPDRFDALGWVAFESSGPMINLRFRAA